MTIKLFAGVTVVAGSLLLVVITALFHREVTMAEAAKSELAAGLARQAFSIESLEQDIATYAGLGHHRSGEPGDLRTTAWLETRLSALGYRTTRQSFSVPSFAIDKATLTIAGRPVAVFPQFPVTFTPHSGLSGRLHPVEKPPEDWAGKIAFVDLPASRRNSSLEQPASYSVIDAAAKSGAMAVIVMLRAECGTYQALNAPVSTPAWPVPVVMVGEQDVDLLEQAVNVRATVELTLTGTSQSLQAFNLISEYGPEGGRPIVISTPQSGWFSAAAERGSGIAAFLALAQWATTKKEQRFIFVANSGHERVNYGAHAFMERFAPQPDETAYWFHIGANVGATGFATDRPSKTRYFMTNWNDLWQSWAFFRGQPGYQFAMPLELNLAAGELADYHQAGYRHLAGVFGSGPYHHCENDTQDKVSAEATRQAALSFAGFLQQVLPRAQHE